MERNFSNTEKWAFQVVSLAICRGSSLKSGGHFLFHSASQVHVLKYVIAQIFAPILQSPRTKPQKFRSVKYCHQENIYVKFRAEYDCSRTDQNTVKSG